jgi:hypothetical protein
MRPPKFCRTRFQTCHALATPTDPDPLVVARAVFRFPVVGYTVIACSLGVTRLYQTPEACSLLVACLFPCVRFTWVVRQNLRLLRKCNTRYEWLTMPYPTRTFTLLACSQLLLAHNLTPLKCFIVFWVWLVPWQEMELRGADGSFPQLSVLQSRGFLVQLGLKCLLHFPFVLRRLEFQTFSLTNQISQVL